MQIESIDGIAFALWTIGKGDRGLAADFGPPGGIKWKKAFFFQFPYVASVRCLTFAT